MMIFDIGTHTLSAATRPVAEIRECGERSEVFESCDDGDIL